MPEITSRQHIRRRHLLLILNLKTAKELGLDAPMHLQQLADEVIE